MCHDAVLLASKLSQAGAIYLILVKAKALVNVSSVQDLVLSCEETSPEVVLKKVCLVKTWPEMVVLHQPKHLRRSTACKSRQHFAFESLLSGGVGRNAMFPDRARDETVLRHLTEMCVN